MRQRARAVGANTWAASRTGRRNRHARRRWRKPPSPSPKKKPEAAKPRERATVKLSYKEQRELDALPATIEALEAEQKQVGGELEDGTIYGRDPERAQKLAERHEAIELELLEALERWEALEAKRAGTV